LFFFATVWGTEQTRDTALSQKQGAFMKTLDTKPIFIATAGNCGVGQLAKLLLACTNCSVLPYGSFALSKKTRLLGPTNFDDHLAQRCVENGVKKLRTLRSPDYALVQDPLFIQAYCEQAVTEFGQQMVVIDLRQNPVDVARLLEEEDAEEPFFARDSPDNAIRLPALATKGFSDLQWALLYWLDTALRIERFAIAYPEVRVLRISYKALFSNASVSKLADRLDLRPLSNFRSENISHDNSPASIVGQGTPLDRPTWMLLCALVRDYKYDLRSVLNWKSDV
jgi:hypothetical protein